jgi:hypothetical protein
VSAHAVRDEPLSAADAVAGFLAAAAIFVSVMTVMNIHLTIEGVSISFEPVKTGVGAELVALFAVALGSGRNRLPSIAAVACAAGWFASMVVAIIVNRPLF